MDDLVDAWHEAPAGSLAACLELHEFLALELWRRAVVDRGRWVAGMASQGDTPKAAPPKAAPPKAAPPKAAPPKDALLDLPEPSLVAKDWVPAMTLTVDQARDQFEDLVETVATDGLVVELTSGEGSALLVSLWVYEQYRQFRAGLALVHEALTVGCPVCGEAAGFHVDHASDGRGHAAARDRIPPQLTWLPGRPRPDGRGDALAREFELE